MMKKDQMTKDKWGKLNIDILVDMNILLCTMDMNVVI